MQRDLGREPSFHVSERSEELRAGGVSQDEAMQSARRQLGTFTAQMERTCEMDAADWLETALRDLRLGGRTLAKTPGFTATVVLTVALGIGVNSAVFSAMYAVLLRPLPFPEGDQLMTLRQSSRKSPDTVVAPIRLQDWNRMNSTFQAITVYYMQYDSELSGEPAEKVKRAFVAPRFLQVWGISPAMGRGFTAEEEHFGGPNAILISGRFWRRRFASDPNVIGKWLRIGAYAQSIAGVMPASFLFPDREVDLWSASAMEALFAQGRELTWFPAVGRLKPGVTVAQARANLATVQANLGGNTRRPMRASPSRSNRSRRPRYTECAGLSESCSDPCPCSF